MLDKAVGVLRATAEGPCGLAELCERTGLPRATAHRLAVGLEAHGMLLRTPDGRWHPGPTLGQLAGGRPDPLLDAAAAVLPRLRDITGESVQLYRRDGIHRICIAHAEPPSGLRDTVPVGSRLPMTAGSGAKVLAAWCDPATQRLVLADASFSERVLVDVRRRGWHRASPNVRPGWRRCRPRCATRRARSSPPSRCPDRWTGSGAVPGSAGPPTCSPRRTRCSTGSPDRLLPAVPTRLR